MEIPNIDTYLKKNQKIDIDNSRQEAIHAVMALMNEHYKEEGAESKKRYKYWNGRLRKYSPTAIHGLIKKAGNGKNPQALFNWLLKK